MYLYFFVKVMNGKLAIVLIMSVDAYGTLFNVYRPSTGKQTNIEKMSHLLEKYERASLEEAKEWWLAQYESSLVKCSHAYWFGQW